MQKMCFTKQSKNDSPKWGTSTVTVIKARSNNQHDVFSNVFSNGEGGFDRGNTYSTDSPDNTGDKSVIY